MVYSVAGSKSVKAKHQSLAIWLFITTPDIISTFLSTLPTLIMVTLFPSSWYHRVYIVSVLPPEDKGASHVNEILVLVVETIFKFVGAEGGPEMSEVKLKCFIPFLKNECMLNGRFPSIVADPEFEGRFPLPLKTLQN